jgi:hypothetical protein
MTDSGTNAISRPATLDAILRSVWQGDLISLGAVAIVGTPTSEVLSAAGEKDTDSPIASVTIASAAGWYAVLTQDCDIARSVDVEPCLQVAPVVYVDEDHWQRLVNGQTSYRYFPLPDKVAPQSPADEDVAAGGKPVVDLRYITNVDKSAFLSARDTHYNRVLTGRHRTRFGQWIGNRFSRVPFDDTVSEIVLPIVRSVLDSAHRQRKQSPAGQRKPPVAFVSCVSEWYVRETANMVEIMGRFDPTLAKAEKLLQIKDGVASPHPMVEQGATALQRQIAGKLDSSAGYSVAVTWFDFSDLTVTEFETYGLWIVQDDPEASAVREET